MIKMVHDAVTIMAPFLFAAAGGLFTELAGTLNIALEGLMLIGAFFSIVFVHFTGSVFIGVTAGVMVTVVFAFLFGAGSLYFKTNIFVSGLAVNLMASGLTVILAGKIFGSKGGIAFSNIKLPEVIHIKWIEVIPIVGKLISGYTVFVYVSWIVLLAVWITVYHTSYGLRLRGTGRDPSTIESLGLKPGFYKLSAILISGAACGLGGAMLTLNVAAFVPGITAGRGWIALVVIYLGNRTVGGILAASFIFGLAMSFSNYEQGVLNIPADIILAFPYALTVAAMTGYAVYKSKISRKEGLE